GPAIGPNMVRMDTESAACWRNPSICATRSTESAATPVRVPPMADLTFRNIINGESVDSLSGQTYDVLDPTTGEVYARAPMSGAEDVDRAYAAAAVAFDAWGETTPKERAHALLKIADAIESRVDEINA